MARKTQSKGKCFFCEKEYTKSGMSKHLKACKARKDALDKAKGKKKEISLHHLVVTDAYSKDYWLHLEMNGDAVLEVLDRYLRAIWLECCGHLSDFLEPVGRGDELSMDEKIDDVFSPGRKLKHIYDWGTSSETMIECVDVRRGLPMTKHAIFLMSRNAMPEEKCAECDKPATLYCTGCLAEEGEWTPLCEKHAKSHECMEDYEPGTIYNSPRMGMCGYDGPAEPPY